MTRIGNYYIQEIGVSYDPTYEVRRAGPKTLCARCPDEAAAVKVARALDFYENVYPTIRRYASDFEEGARG